MEEQIAQLEQAVAELQQKVAQFDATTFAETVRNELALWQDRTVSLIQNLEVQLLDTIRRIDGLDALLQKADALLKQLEGIDLEGLDPEKIKQAVLAEIASWQTQTDSRIGALELRVTKLEADIQLISPEKILQDVMLALQSWQTDLENDLALQKAGIAALSAELARCKTELETQIQLLKDKDEAHDLHFTQLEKDLADLLLRVNEIAQEGIDTRLIQAEVERLIGDWKLSVETRLLALEGMSTLLNSLKTRLDTLPPILSEAEIKLLITKELALLKAELEAKITALGTQDTSILADLATMTAKIAALEIKINAQGGNGLGEADIKVLISVEIGVLQLNIDQKINALNLDLLAKIEQLKISLTADISGLNTRLLLVEALVNASGNINITNIVTLVIQELEAWKILIIQRVSVLEAQRVVDRQDIDILIQGLSNLSAKVSALVILTQIDVNTQINIVLAPWITQIESIKVLILNLETHSSTNTVDITSLKAELEALTLLLAGPLPDHWETQVQQMIDALLSSIKADIIQLKLDKTTLETALQTLQTALSGLQADLAALSVVVENLPVPLTEIEINALIGVQINVLQVQLELHISTLEVQITTLETAHADILIVIANIQTSMISQEVTINLLQQLIIEVKTTVENLPPILLPADIIILINSTLASWKQDIEIKIQALETCCTEGKAHLAALDLEILDIKKTLQQSDASAIGIRLARRCLTGWGIVGGLELKSDDTCSIHLSKGSGITPRGVLTHACTGHYFTHYRKFVRPANDPIFKNYELWELLVWEDLGIAPGAPVPSDIHPLTPQTGAENPLIADKAVLLLPGETQNHYLLIKIEDLIALSGKTADLHHCMDHSGFDPDLIFSEAFSPMDALPTDQDLYQAFNPVMILPEIPLFRFGFRPVDECDPEDLDFPNFPMICSLDQMYDNWLPIIQDAFRQIDRWVKKVMEQYHELLFPQLDKDIFEGKLELLFEKWTAFTQYNKHALPNKTRKFYVQYFYDWARDLIAAYHELRSELQVLMAELCICRPDLLLEQRPWLMLGIALRPDQDGLAAPLRDGFHQSPIFNSNMVRLETCRLYYRRQFEMIEGFYLPGYEGDMNLPCWCKHQDEAWKPDFSAFKITPSKSYIYPLSQQSLPFYYPLAPNMESLHFYWEYRRAKMRQVDYHLSYHASDSEDAYSNRPQVVRPLYYNLDPYNFYRIEGFIGNSMVPLGSHSGATPLEALKYKIKQYNLDFEVVELDIYCNECRFLTQKYPHPDMTVTEFFHSFRQDIMGAEHVAGVPKGGTFIIVSSKMVLDDVSQTVAIADFMVPYRCCPPKPVLCKFGVSVTMDRQCLDGKREIKITVSPETLRSGTFQLTLDGKPLPGVSGAKKGENGQFGYENNLPLTITAHVPADDKTHSIRVKDLDLDCCGEAILFVPDCRCRLTVQAFPRKGCVGGKALVDVTITAINPEGGFYMKVDNRPYPFDAPLGYVFDQNDGISTMTIEVPADGWEHLIYIETSDNPNCNAQTKFCAPKCESSIELEVVAGTACMIDRETSFELIVSSKNPPGEAMVVKFDGNAILPVSKDLKYHPSGTTLLSFNVLGDGKTHTLEVLDAKDPSISANAEVRVMHCLNLEAGAGNIQEEIKKGKKAAKTGKK